MASIAFKHVSGSWDQKPENPWLILKWTIIMDSNVEGWGKGMPLRSGNFCWAIWTWRIDFLSQGSLHMQRISLFSKSWPLGRSLAGRQSMWWGDSRGLSRLDQLVKPKPLNFTAKGSAPKTQFKKSASPQSLPNYSLVHMHPERTSATRPLYTAG